MKRILSVLLLAFIMLVGFAACGGSDEPATGLVVILGNHANAKRITEDDLQKCADIFNSAYTREEDSKGNYTAYANIAVIVADGDPEIEALEDFETGYLDSSNRAANRELKIEKNNEKLFEILTDESRLRAQEEGVDLVEAFNKAEFYLNGLDVVNRKILCFDTMLPTQGLVDFTVLDYAEKTPQELYDYVYSQNPDLLPKLSGIEVIVKGALDICGYQNDGIQNPTYTENIVSFWKLFFGDSLKSISSSSSNGSAMLYLEGSADSYPYVPAIPVPEYNKLVAEEKKEEHVVDDTIVFRSEELNFKMDQAVFVNKEKSVKYIEKTASEKLKQILARDPARKIYVVGSIAVNSKNEKYDTSSVSSGRASVVADVLIENCKIPASNICVLDCGTNKLPWRDAEEFVNGKWIEEEAAKNRVVTIVCSDEGTEDYEVLKPYINNSKHIVK